MLLNHYKKIFFNELSSIYDKTEIESFFYIIVEFLHYKKRIDLALNPKFSISETELTKWNSITSDLKKQKPIQYVLGETNFFGLTMRVDENTLIPRPETEELVQWIIDDSKNKSLTILDIGTGSGCIAIALAKNISNAKVYALDVSPKAIEIAKKNAEINNGAVQFICCDILKLNCLNEISSKFDIIVSNPPYVRNLEKATMKANVLEYEPHLALFVDDHDALLFYRKIAQLAIDSLSTEGKLYFEINQYLGKEMVELLTNIGFKNTVLKKDIYGNDRMIRAMRE